MQTEEHSTMSELFYPMEQLTNAVSIMATHPNGIKERLYGAFVEFHTIGNDMPYPFREDYEWIHHELTKVNGESDGAIIATLDSMTDEHAVEIARRIVALASQIAREWWQQPFTST